MFRLKFRQLSEDDPKAVLPQAKRAQSDTYGRAGGLKTRKTLEAVEYRGLSKDGYSFKEPLINRADCPSGGIWFNTEDV